MSEVHLERGRPPGRPFLLLGGLATVISPPKAEYKSAANKRRIEVLGIIGLVLGAVELYFYNDIYGVR